MTWDQVQDRIAERMMAAAQTERLAAGVRYGRNAHMPQNTGRPRSHGSLEAERLLRAGINRLAVRQATGMSRWSVRRLDIAIREERKAA